MASGSLSALKLCAFALFSLLIGSPLLATPASISSFPYTPNESAQSTDFEADYGSGPTTNGSAFSNGTISSPRQGEGGASVQAWANEPTANYKNNTVSWLHSPIFNFNGQSGLELRFYLWIKAQANRDGMKMQVSTNGGSSWSDVTTMSIAYNGSVAGSLLSSNFGGGNNCWNGTSLGGSSANLCRLDLNTWAGQSDTRFRWCFVSNATNNDNGPVLDSFSVVPITATVGYTSGFVAVPQGSSVVANISKTGGSNFTSSGMTVTFAGSGVTGSVTSFTDANNIQVTFTATRTADVDGQTFWVNLSGGNHVCQGIVTVFWPHFLIPSRQGGSLIEPPGSAAVGANSVYLHNGEFRHDLPIVSIPGRMLPLAVGITYRSQADTVSPIGAGWTASFDQRLYYWSGSDTIDLYSGDGRIDTFTLQSGGTAGTGPYTVPFAEMVAWITD